MNVSLNDFTRIHDFLHTQTQARTSKRTLNLVLTCLVFVRWSTGWTQFRTLRELGSTPSTPSVASTKRRSPGRKRTPPRPSRRIKMKLTRIASTKKGGPFTSLSCEYRQRVFLFIIYFLIYVASDGINCYLIHFYRSICFTTHSRQIRLLQNIQCT